ncbi:MULTISPECIES: hypothetical protein [Vibrio]|uniref:hypothetical protein n=1 Tax=Vibrio TaxID=662 RepID=UPI000C818785|nr:hypothetical protein [Vibrio splendidus]PMK40343.1 hypothetical protein BCU01_18250 [Vibrio splendidus]PMP37488.1 hypothetical protein BCS86_22440 [Vibrio splendidus]
MLNKKSVWFVVISFIVFALLIGYSITTNLNESELEIMLDHRGFTKLIEIYALPLKIVAFLIPLLGLMALHFNYKQIQEQISIAIDQNTFSNYFKHRESFYEHAAKHNTIDITHANLLYNLMYPDSHKTAPRLDDNFNCLASDLLTEYLKMNIESYDKAEQVQVDNIQVSANRFNTVFHLLGVDPTHANMLLDAEKRAVKQLDGMQNIEFYSRIRPQLRVVEYIVTHLNNQGLFDRDYKQSKQVGVFLKYSNIWSVQRFKSIQQGLIQRGVEEPFDPSSELLQMFKNVLTGTGVTRH